ncbi:MAG: GH13_21 / GH13_20 / GH13 / GH13_36 / GH13_ 16 / GH13_23 / GH13_31 / GH13_40 / GH13_2 / GH13 _17 / GH13_29 / GH13_30 / GH13_4 / GH13_1 / GH13 _35 / GH13_19 / GH13_37 [uncultured Truepera sp.]|uniref:GH13_21 / GH13_20 / GH13 / GH13_36 / GH13_ 16 / GH13_23 / GH13_31 / GH13_40 / GH13_2 / GH13 _17 / GH13_29 / GH13_30 / GH13_4 / GH13_1 / GH13 _35 / GH13_19 / GH13_37 n=1 Tax=uncultured Truepera sp. TaxID=543023 RepID=A0A6J4VJH2_9DEIN|nr:MAG: GH13_21 / GH13_20 / GH13 / GH13_36 / GH13_ 16 / GH13_23 / GH13_31 / GH13_40 / GH13_2 / GH13 _17 / GH13_29 / GH13_30 / GH13_4 / GH13_1 / GH13 _35 / GH13_19 / GH13_37 [uncultured Truepera sp.]
MSPITLLHDPLRGRRHEDGRVTVTLQTSQPVTAAWVRSEPDNEEFLSPLTLRGHAGRRYVYEGELRVNPAAEVTVYAFKVLPEGAGQVWLSELGQTPYFPERAGHFRINPSYEPVPWLWSQVFYQIFPERFCDGDPSNNVASGEYLYEGKPVVAKAWGELPERGQGAREFYGGDLEGVRQKLPYLQALGVTALYLNPVFTSPSSHKYDTVDYLFVDPHFGGNGALERLCSELRERGFRLILDAVVNHTSERHPWFDRYGEHAEVGAYGGGETRGFYSFASEDPDSYHGWVGVKTLPVLDFSHPVVRRRVYEDPDALLRVWLRPPYSIDGWRFDVVHMLGDGPGAKNNAAYVRGFRRALREENPEALVLGEHFFEATTWLQGDQEDSAMNYYGFTLPVRTFLAGVDHRGHPLTIDAHDFDHLLTRARAQLPFGIQLSQFNLLGSHDVPRMLTILGGDVARLKLAITLLLAYIGVPCVYYGDEIGLEGGGDPDCRRTFPWDEARWNRDILAHYRTLIAFRRERRVLQEGLFAPLYAEGDVYAFARVLDAEVVVVIVNRGGEAEINLDLARVGLDDETLASLFGSETFRIENATLSLTLGACESRILFTP